MGEMWGKKHHTALWAAWWDVPPYPGNPKNPRTPSEAHAKRQTPPSPPQGLPSLPGAVISQSPPEDATSKVRDLAR